MIALVACCTPPVPIALDVGLVNIVSIGAGHVVILRDLPGMWAWCL
jgi:hypothetical protein